MIIFLLEDVNNYENFVFVLRWVIFMFLSVKIWLFVFDYLSYDGNYFKLFYKGSKIICNVIVIILFKI